MIEKGKKFISPGAWFSLIYPSSWNEFEDAEDSFLFYNPNKWTGNFRISAYRDDRNNGYGKESVDYELKQNENSSLVKLGELVCAYSKEMFQEEGSYYVTHVYHLNIGQPDLPTPKAALEAIRNIDRKILEYSPSDGYKSYREKLTHYYAKYNINLTADDIIITTGGSEAVLFAFMSCNWLYRLK